MTQLSPTMKIALERLRRRGEVGDVLLIGNRTMLALEKRGLVRRIRNVRAEVTARWTITEVGRAALNPPSPTREVGSK